MSFNPATYETIPTTSRRSALAKDDSRHQNTAATSQNLIDFSDEDGESAIAAGTSDDDELMFEFEDDIETGTLKKHPEPTTTPNDDLYDFEEMPYIHHFVNKDGATNFHGSLATTIKPNKDASTVSSSNKAHEEPNVNPQLPEDFYFGPYLGPNDSGSDLFYYGPPFSPSRNQDTFRTITISGIPANIDLLSVLNKIRGGAILESQLLDTVPITGFKTARIVFLDELSALAFEDNAVSHPSMFRGLNVTADLVDTPTWPVEYNCQHSRCMEINNVPSAIKPKELLEAIGHEMNHPIYMRKLNNGNIILHFSSIKKAELAYGLLPRTYRGCQPHFIADPCSEPLEPVEALLPPRVFLPV